MFNPFACSTNSDASQRHRQYQQRKLEMLRFISDGLERRLAAVKASMQTLEDQIQRDQQPAI